MENFGMGFYLLMLLLVILITLLGLFSPHLHAKLNPQSSDDRRSWIDCLNFASCILGGAAIAAVGFFGFGSDLAGLLGGSLALYGVMYFIGLLAHDADNARLLRETRARQVQSPVRETRDHQVPNPVRETRDHQVPNPGQLPQEPKLSPEEEAYERYVDDVYRQYLEAIILGTFYSRFEQYPGNIYLQFLLEVESFRTANTEVTQWRETVLMSIQMAEHKHFLREVRLMAHAYMDDFLAKKRRR